MPPVRPAPAIGLIGQVALLALLDATTGLGVAGWVAGVGYGLVLSVLLVRSAGLGPADWVTLARAALAGCLTALTAAAFTRPIQAGVLVAIAIVALVLDAIDGRVARHSGTSSAFGARFDMEVDAFVLLVLSVFVARSVGAWVLAIGAMRYAYVAAGWVMPWLRGNVPSRYWRKVVAAVQGIVLVVAASGVLPGPVVVGALLVSLALLIESFGSQALWLWRERYPKRAYTSPERPSGR